MCINFLMVKPDVGTDLWGCITRLPRGGSLVLLAPCALRPLTVYVCLGSRLLPATMRSLCPRPLHPGCPCLLQVTFSLQCTGDMQPTASRQPSQRARSPARELASQNAADRSM